MPNIFLMILSISWSIDYAFRFKRSISSAITISRSRLTSWHQKIPPGTYIINLILLCHLFRAWANKTRHQVLDMTRTLWLDAWTLLFDRIVNLNMTFCGCINPSEMMTLRLQILKFSLLTQRPPQEFGPKMSIFENIENLIFLRSETNFGYQIFIPEQSEMVR